MPILSDPATRAKAVKLAKESAVREPLITRAGWGFVALCLVLGGCPGFMLVFRLSDILWPYVIPGLGSKPAESPGFLAAATFAVLFGPPLLLLYYVTGRYVCTVTLFYASQGKSEDAETVALGMQNFIWYLHVRTNTQFRQFLQTQRLGEKSERYRKYLSRVHE